MQQQRERWRGRRRQPGPEERYGAGGGPRRRQHHERRLRGDSVDTAFLTDAIKGDNSEIQLGQLAQNTASASKGVKEFGQTLVTDHSNAKQQAAQLAQQAGMQVPDEIKDAAKQEMTKLKGMSVKAFDQEFASYMVQDHKKDIAKFEQQANGTGPTAQLAQQTLPTLKKHLQIAESLNK